MLSVHFICISLAIASIFTSEASQSAQLSPSNNQIQIDSAVKEYRYAVAVKILNQNFQWPTDISKMRSSCPQYQLGMKMKAIKHIFIASDTTELPKIKSSLGIDNIFYIARDQQLGKRALLKYRRINARQRYETRRIAQWIRETEATSSDDESSDNSDEE